MAKSTVPVYLFTGFLSAGKTKMIQEILEDKEFNDGSKILLLICEEGEEEYDPTRYWGKNVRSFQVESEKDLTKELLASLTKEHATDRVMLEYNGMWQMDALYRALPDNWFVFQQIFIADATTAENYNANMRALVFDKLQNAETVIFNRADGIDRAALHKLVRGVSRRANIAYETAAGEMEYDDIEDPLPFDVNAPVVKIEDEDYALFYRDLSENLNTYAGKTVKFKGMAARDRSLGKASAVVGRHVMTCCEADIAYNGLVAVFAQDTSLSTGEWVMLTGKIQVEAHPLYSGKGPVLYVTDVAKTSPPKKEVATFY